jgi:Flp pilus assembly protein TadD
MPQRQRNVLDSAISSYIDAQLTNADRPEAHVNIGLVHFAREHFDQAEQAFAQAIGVDSFFVPAYVNLAELRRVQGRDTDGEAILNSALVFAPDIGTIHHALGLLYVRQRRMPEALDALRRAAELAPDDARFAYVYGVALHSEGRVDEAVAVLDGASTKHPYDLELLGTLVAINRDRGNFAAAIRHAERLSNLVPGNRNFRILLDQLRTQTGR